MKMLISNEIKNEIELFAGKDHFINHLINASKSIFSFLIVLLEAAAFPLTSTCRPAPLPYLDPNLSHNTEIITP